ncbi:MAG: cytochrome bd ubiquinol oxidase subunit [Pseudomonadota bacterium]|nr:cytochrome bd ubiquinol oxidase subunit [Pseudomonadota bacterium]
METLVNLSRLQFGITAMYHFMFVPLTLGMTWLLVIMESLYVVSGKVIYKDMTKFWGKLFGINFVIGVTTGLTLEFQFGTNWAYYSHYVGDIFGVPLAIEGLMAFFLESTFVGMFFFAWDRVSKKQHLLFTVLVAIGSNLSALWILIANGWMQNPVGTIFNPITMRMELDSFWSVLFNPVGQAKFFHTVCAGYVTASIFVLGISSYYLLKKQDLAFAKQSFRIAAVFGLLATIAVIIMGDASGLQVYKVQKTKLAAIEGVWNTSQAPAGWSLLAWPNQDKRENNFNIEIPYAGSLILTHGLHGSITGINELIAENKQKIIRGRQALLLLEQLRKTHNNSPELVKQIQAQAADLGYAMLLYKYTDNINNATAEQIDMAAMSTVPNPLPLYYAFRGMVGFGASFLILFIVAVLLSNNKSNIMLEDRTKFLKFALFWIPAPWLASWCGWFVAEYGRQPWTIYGILPTYQSVSSLTSGQLAFSLTGFVVIYTLLAIVEIWLMLKYAKLGPSSLGTGRYYFEAKKV